MKCSQLAFALSALTAGAISYAQQAPNAEDRIRHRQSIMNVMHRQFGMLSVTAKGDVPYNKETAIRATSGTGGSADPGRVSSRIRECRARALRVP